MHPLLFRLAAVPAALLLAFAGAAPAGAALLRDPTTGESSGAALSDPAILAMSARIKLVEAADLNARFPAERFARVTLTLADGRVLKSEATPARGDAERPLSDAEILAKFHEIAEPTLGSAGAHALRDAIEALPRAASVAGLLDLLLAGPAALAKAS